MIQMTLSQAAELFGLKNTPENVTFHGMSIDTRTLQPGNLFVALPGERVNGHDFLDAAKQQGAAAALVTQKMPSALTQLQVEDTVLAMGKLGTAWRNRFSIPFIAVTGSNGKTTSKNMIAAILTTACQDNTDEVLANKGTLNNHLGLPLTLAELHGKHRYAVLEMGMNHFGEIAYLTELAKPNVAVITNAAESHLEGVQDVAGVARAKAEIFQGLQKDGFAILNQDDAFFNYWREQIGNHPYLSFGLDSNADITATRHEQHITLQTPQGHIDIQLPLLGKHNVQNALAAAAATLAIGIDLSSIRRGLENIKSAPGRLQLRTLANGVKIIDDTYNANPFSLQAAVETLATFAGKKILVLGDMKELGAEAKLLHKKAGEKIRSAGIDYLFTYGELTSHTAIAFGEQAYHFTEQEKLIDALKPLLYNQTTILIKGSRSMHMEKVVAELAE